MRPVVSLARTITALSLGVALSACHTTGTTRTEGTKPDIREYCEEHPEVCVLVGAVVVGGVLVIASRGGGNGSGDNGGGNFGSVSDIRLKSDMQFVGQLENGINLYAFRYTGDDRVFVGVLAQEVLADERHAHAIVDTGNDFLGVDYQALGLVMINEAEMRAAGAAALVRALAN